MLQETSRLAYQETAELRKTQLVDVLKAIKENPLSTDYEIAIITGIARHEIPDRRGKLVKQGKVVQVGKRRCSITGMTVFIWRAVGETQQMMLL